jgi:hypothetical protein
MAESQSADDAPTADQYDYDADYTIDDDEAQSFAEAALGNIRTKLKSNLGEARGMTDRFNESSDGVDEILSPENVREIQVRARPLENPKVTVWLKDAPIWANDAWTDYIYPNGLNAYNGKVTTSFDVREF